MPPVDSKRRITDFEQSNSPHEHAIRIALLEQSMDGIKGELHSINANITKLVWIVVAALLSSMVQFVLRGGTHV